MSIPSIVAFVFKSGVLTSDQQAKINSLILSGQVSLSDFELLEELSLALLQGTVTTQVA